MKNYNTWLWDKYIAFIFHFARFINKIKTNFCLNNFESLEVISFLLKNF